MSKINAVRIINLNYNHNMIRVDDETWQFNGESTLLSLRNGGGKSVLMLLLLQNLIPNCTLDEKQPIEKLFRTSEGRRGAC